MYRITVINIDDVTGEATGPATELDVDKDGQVRELRVKANGHGLVQFPAVDFGAIALAFIGPQINETALAAPVAPQAPSEPAATTTTGRTRKAAAAPRKRAAKKAAPVATEGEATSRVYRRMPPQDEVLAAYNEHDGSVAKLADHFEVPRHTATGWVRNLRKSGALAPAAAE